MQTSQLSEYFENRKWHQVLNLLYNNADLHVSVSFLKTNASVLVSKAHPLSLVKLLSKITNLCPDLELLLLVEKELGSNEIRNEEQEEALAITRINIHILTLPNVEPKIYEYKQKEHSPEIMKRLNKLFYLYYESIGDTVQAYDALKLYLDTDPENEDIKMLANKLARFALESDEIYFFEDVLKYLNYIDCKDLIMAYNSGDVKYVLKNCNEFSVDKVYLISFLNMCSIKRKIALKDISVELGLCEEAVFFLILKALGKGLVKGYLDGESRVFHMNSVVSKILDNNEIKVMKEKFTAWKMRVSEAIKSI